MSYKFQFLAKNSVFWALVVSSRPLNHILQVPDSMEHVLRGMVSWVAGACFKQTSIPWYGSRKIGVSGPPHPKKWQFLAKNGLKLPILGTKTVSLDTGAQFKTLLPFFLDA